MRGNGFGWQQLLYLASYNLSATIAMAQGMHDSVHEH